MPLSLVSTLPLALPPVWVGVICANATVATVVTAVASVINIRMFSPWGTVAAIALITPTRAVYSSADLLLVTEGGSL